MAAAYSEKRRAFFFKELDEWTQFACGEESVKSVLKKRNLIRDRIIYRGAAAAASFFAGIVKE